MGGAGPVHPVPQKARGEQSSILPALNNIPRELERPRQFPPQGQGCKLLPPPVFISYRKVTGHKEGLVIAAHLPPTQNAWLPALLSGKRAPPAEGDPLGEKVKLSACPTRGVPPLRVSEPHWKKKSCLGSHVKYANTNENR